MLESNCPDLTLVARGKVRDIYAIPGEDDKLLFVASDRISAYDVILDSVSPSLYLSLPTGPSQQLS
jgi:phosphoribosylaminoimidazole-succinocarboxamide synthase